MRSKRYLYFIFQGCEEKVIPLVTKLVWPLRNALSSKSESVFDGALQILKLFKSSNIS